MKRYYNNNQEEIMPEEFKLPSLPNIEMIAMQPSYNAFAYLSREEKWKVTMATKTFEGNCCF